ncbi:MAG: YggS family pyridoxal phosphate-dependent enzyme [Clostridia bacterium]|nr:YggS family pyridoxal phosphate-dependent enzyme [Clostridia bacterium]
MQAQSYTNEILHGKQRVEECWKRVRFAVEEAAIRSGRDPSEVRLMAVTKTVEPVYINHAISLGATLIGENKVQEFLGKKPELTGGYEAHLIGHLQTNKVRQIVGEVDVIQSVDSVRLAREIGKCAEKKGVVCDVLLEVNIGRDPDKFGIMPDAAAETACEIAEIPGVRVCGLMTVPPLDADLEKTQRFFSNMHQLFIDISKKKIHNIDMRILSMGMSGDYPQAIAEGATLVRVGTAIFGSRNYR